MTAGDAPHAGYRHCVGLVLVNPSGLVFAGHRINGPGDAWQMPQGGIDPGETPVQAALRELNEETGTDKVVVLAESTRWLRYDFPAEWQKKFWGGRFRGQTQKWFVMRFTGGDDDIDIHAEDAEFDAWIWMGLDELARQIVDFKRGVYREVLAEFTDLIEAELSSG